MEKPERVVCIPFFHNFSHNLLAVAARFRVKVVFTSDFKLNRLTPFVGGAQGCQKRHREAAVHCQVRVVHDIPMACGSYVGQTKRCLRGFHPRYICSLFLIDGCDTQPDVVSHQYYGMKRDNTAMFSFFLL